MVVSTNRLSALVLGIFFGFFMAAWFYLAVKTYLGPNDQEGDLLVFALALVAGGIPLSVTIWSLRAALTGDKLVLNVPGGIITRRGRPLVKVKDVSQVKVEVVKGEDKDYYGVKILVVSGGEHLVELFSGNAGMLALAEEIGELLDVEVVVIRA